jgi:curved DNA-binding protein CbpA
MNDSHHHNQQEQQEQEQEPKNSNQDTFNNDNDLIIQKEQDPYSILNVSQHANLEEIQKSYKLLSRSFHPDKQPPGIRRDAAQKYFIQLKASYDILMDPVLRLAYDDHGTDGVLFLKKAASLYKDLQDLIQLQLQQQQGQSIDKNCKEWVQIRQLLSESIQYYYLHTMGTKYQGRYDPNHTNSTGTGRSNDRSSASARNTTTIPTNIPLLQAPETSAEIKIKCSTTHSPFLFGEGIDLSSQHPMEVESLHMSVNLMTPLQSSSSTSNGFQKDKDNNNPPATGIMNHKNITFGAHTGLHANGQGNYYGGQISMQCEPIPNTDMTADVQFGPLLEDMKFTIGTTRIMSSSRTFVSTSWSTPLYSFLSPLPSLSPMPITTNTTATTNATSSSSKQDTTSVLTFTTHRSLFQDSYHALFIMGLTQKFKFLYGLLQCSTNDPEQKTKYTAKLNVGMNYTPIQIIAEHSFQDDERHKGKFTIGFGMRGFDLQAILTRYISKYCKLSLGLHHVSSTGLTWLFQLQRDTLQFTVPIFISSSLSPTYAVKTMYSGLILGLLDASIGDYINSDNILYDLRQYRIQKRDSDDETTIKAMDMKREEWMLEREKIKHDAIQQIKLMKGPADIKRKREEDNNGLVILNAIYSIVDGESIDVTECLMFWVAHSSLRLPSMPKSSMLGFYDVRKKSTSNPNTSGDLQQSFSLMTRLHNLWKKLILRETAHGDTMKCDNSSTAVPTLYVRYRFKGELYEITVNDEEELTLPSKNAMRLGGANVT